VTEAIVDAHVAGSLVRTRGRDWVVLPSREPNVLKLRPLTGGENEAIGLFVPLDGHTVASTSFAPPDAALAGDAVGAGLLLDAARLSLRSGAAPFRSLGRISVVPRPYQLVPLVMALRLDPVRHDLSRLPQTPGGHTNPEEARAHGRTDGEERPASGYLRRRFDEAGGPYPQASMFLRRGLPAGDAGSERRWSGCENSAILP